MHVRFADRVPWHAFLLPMLGILFYRLTAWSVYGSSYTSAVSAYTYSRLAQLAATIVLVIVVPRCARSVAQMRCAIALGTGIMLVGAALSTGFAADTAAFTAGRVLHGVGSAMLFVGWGAYTCALEPRYVAPSVACTFAVYGIATFLLESAPPAVTTAIAFAAPVLCGSLLAYCTPKIPLSIPTDNRDSTGSEAKGRRTGLPWGALGLLAACSLACAITELFISPNPGTLATYTANVFRIPVFCAIALFFLMWTRICGKDDPDRLWSLFALVISCGLLGYSSFSPFNANVALGFMRATQDCLMMFAWVYVAGLVYRKGFPAFTTFGLATVVFMRTDLPASLIRMAFPDFAVTAGGLVTTGLSFTLALLLIVYTIVLANRRPPETGKTAVPTSTNGASDGALPRCPAQDTPVLAGWTVRYGLSARENQVVDLLLHGYTLHQLADRLGISLNTVRWYTKGIYRKLGIHSKSELVELAEEFEQGTSRPH